MTDTTRMLLAILASVVIVGVSAVAGHFVYRRVTHFTFEQVQMIRLASQGGEVAAR
jgi:uncharacterized membrane protein YjfL (UPF0719 family)